MKITDLKEDECIHCATDEEAKRICKMMDDAGLKWSCGDSYLDYTNWEICKDETVYYPKLGHYSSTRNAKDDLHTIYPSHLFQSPENVPIAILDWIGEELNKKFESDPAIRRTANVIINEFKKRWK